MAAPLAVVTLPCEPASTKLAADGPRPQPQAGVAHAAPSSFDYVSSIRDHPQLSQEDKTVVLWLLAQSPAFARLITADDIGVHDQPAWVHCAEALGIDVSRQDPVPPERVFKMRGIAEIALDTQICYDLVTDFEQMKKWDSMLQSMEVLSSEARQYPVLRAGTFINTYGVPGLSWLFNDRQFLCRGIGIAFPDGTRALAVYSPADGSEPADPGVTKPRTIRAHMGTSGYVVTPYAGEERRALDAGHCQFTMVLQVDPRGSVPLPVYNAISCMMPMNLQRVKAAAAKLRPEERAMMGARQSAALAESQALLERSARGGKAKPRTKH